VIQYIGLASTVTTTPKFIQANLRGTTEWFAVVNQSMKTAISNYASGTDGPFRRDSADPATVVTWNNIVTTLMTDMDSLFRDNSTFNQPIGSWDTSNVTDMDSVFYQAQAFNQNIGSWNTANVTTMSFMFYAKAFNQNISSWDIAKVVSMSGMFFNAVAFNQNISNWNLNLHPNVLFFSFRAGSGLSTDNTPLRFRSG
jgi:surface protein